jgi:hypothetical protein
MEITTDLEAFEYVTKGLLKQGIKSLNSNFECVYRGYKEQTIKEVRDEADEIAGLNEEKYHELLEEIIGNLPYETKCAAGFLISDHLYESAIESSPASADYVASLIKESNPKWNYTTNSEDLVVKLQQIHDSTDTSKWNEKFESMLEDFDGTDYTPKGFEE